MNYSKIQKAIKFATKTHEIYQKQKRKGKDVSYITHPLTVGIILASIGASEDVVCAGILHDTIEDSIEEKKVTPEMLEDRFGREVAQLVLDVTETDKSLAWEERKKQALEHIKHFSHDSLLVKSADLLSNLSELVDDYEKDGEQIFERFNAPKEKKLKNSLQTISTIIVSWPANPVARELRRIADQLQMIGASEFMVRYPAKIVEHADYDENTQLTCPVCNWQGTPKSSDCVNTDSDFCLSVSCPICDKMLLIANYASASPTDSGN